MQRILLWERRNNTVEPFGETVQQVYARISALRDRLDGPVVSVHLNTLKSPLKTVDVASPACMLKGYIGRRQHADCHMSWGCSAVLLHHAVVLLHA